jgi:hypothetical protein
MLRYRGEMRRGKRFTVGLDKKKTNKLCERDKCSTVLIVKS